MPHPPRPFTWFPTDRLPDNFGPRAAGVFFTLAIQILLAALLLSMAPPIIRQKLAEMAMFSVSEVPDTPKNRNEPEKQESSGEPEAPPTPLKETPPKPPSPEPAPQPPVEIPLELPAAVPEAPPTRPAPAPDRPMMGPPDFRPSRGVQADTPRVEGSGPNGEPLYAAAWYREPYDDELKGYLSTARGPGWGLIACRTAADYRVEDCVIMGEYPNGSGIARAVQAAAWQFKVRPPRIGGRYQVGEWVQIRIDYGTGAKRR